MFSVGAGGIGGIVGLAGIDLDLAGYSNLGFPAQLAFRANAHENDVLALDSRQENAVSPDHRCRTGLSWRQWKFPSDVFILAPLEGNLGLIRNAIVVGAAPQRPVVGAGDSRAAGYQGQAKEDGAFHGSVPNEILSNTTCCGMVSRPHRNKLLRIFTGIALSEQQISRHQWRQKARSSSMRISKITKISRSSPRSVAA